jgi:hypothetical protein
MTQFTCKGVKQINNGYHLNTFTIRISRRFSSARETLIDINTYTCLMAEQVVQMTAHCPKNIVQFKSTIYVLMMHQVDLIPITMLFCHINSKSN